MKRKTYLYPKGSIQHRKYSSLIDLDRTDSKLTPITEAPKLISNIFFTNRNTITEVDEVIFGKRGSERQKFSPYKKEHRFFFETRNNMPMIKKIRKLRQCK